ncbi:MAG: type II toxin-antitoxin system VapC family toxin [Actinomycetota bacterium]|nr:type II toxin-antitoxin system VapC family toxin [Actinomycetota bacterium]
MVIDTSAVMAVLLGEPQRAALESLLVSGPCRMSAVTRVELAMVTEGRAGAEGARIADEFLERFDVDVRSVDALIARSAINAWRRFGKGRHPAGLNFGDCFSYALAIELGEPLLFVGGDFSKTDVDPALTI